MPMPYGADPTAGNPGRDRITQALLNIQNPPPQIEMPQPPPMPPQGMQGQQGMPPPGPTPSMAAAGAMPLPQPMPPGAQMGGMMGGAGGIPLQGMPPPQGGQLPPQVQQQLQQPQQIPPTGY
jgi:hypothetical protein